MKTCPVCDTPYPDQHSTCPIDGAVLIASRELVPGQVVRGKYRIVSKLGQGGMGSVYLAEHLMLGGQMALKFLAADLSHNPQFIKRFRQEARAAYQLRHPNIVEVADLDQDEDGSLFIAMEYVAGPNLRTVLNQSPNGLPVSRSLHIARGVAEGLAAAHSRGTIHRDIKPENILLRTPVDGADQAKILDFGIAAMTEAITNISHTHGLLLTPEYAAPEQWRGTPAAELDGRTDLYALGGVLYEMLAGRTPFRARNMEGWMFQHLQGVPEPLGNLRPNLAHEYPAIEPLVMRLLSREREQRFSSAPAFLEALSHATVPKPHEPHRITVIETPPPKPQARPKPEPVPKPEPEAPPQSNKLKVFLAVLLLLAVLGIGGVALFMQSRPYTEIPQLSPSGGTYSEPQTVTMSDTTPNATIHYTLDGSEPGESSPVYSQPIEARSSVKEIRAMATADGHKPSAEIQSSYTWANAPQLPGAMRGTGPYDQAKSLYDRKQYGPARTLFSQACDAGQMAACNYLGYLYAQGLGVQKDLQKAQIIYQKACDQGTLSSCASLGSLYQNAGDNDSARAYFKKACDGGSSTGCELLRGVQ